MATTSKEQIETTYQTKQLQMIMTTTSKESSLCERRTAHKSINQTGSSVWESDGQFSQRSWVQTPSSLHLKIICVGKLYQRIKKTLLYK